MGAFHTIDTLDPWHNLAVERHLFETFHASAGDDESMLREAHALLVWRNSPCVVVGRHQNPWVECDLERMERDGVPLVRRISGGGAVYHDTGNMNFSFMGTASAYDLDRHFGVILAALDLLGIHASRNARNDLLVGEGKISGSAYRHTRQASLHHGTLLFRTDLNQLSAYLMAGEPETGSARQGVSVRAVTESKGIPSVRSKVANLRDSREDLTYLMLTDAIRAAYLAEYGSVGGAGGPQPGFPPTHVAAALRIESYERELRSWDWRYGKTPTFACMTEPANQASVSLTVTVRRGLVESLTTASPPEDHGLARAVASAEQRLCGIAFMRDDLRARAQTASGVERLLIEAVAAVAAPGESPFLG